MPRRTSVADGTPVRVVLITLDTHIGGALERAAAGLARDLPGLDVRWHAASEWNGDGAALARCHADIAQGDIILANMLFLEEHIEAVLPQLRARRDHCDAMVGCMSAGEVIRLTRLGRFDMAAPQSGALAWLKRLRGSGKSGASSGAKQMAMMRRLPRLLRFIPGTAQDVRSYFLTLQYWLAGSEDNLANLLRHLITRYADGARRGLRGQVQARAPIEYPEIGAYHPRLPERVTEVLRQLPPPPGKARGTVGLLILRSYVLTGNTAHYDGVIAALEARGLRVLPIFASGLDARPAVERYFIIDGRPTVDAVVSLTGFSLVGGPAYNDARAAEDILARLDVPYLVAVPVEFQTLNEWETSSRGLTPLEATMMVALPELDGASGPIVFGGRGVAGREMVVHEERAALLADRVAKLVQLRRRAAAERRIAVVLFNFPPNAGSVGTAAYLDVFSSLFNTLAAMRDAGYDVQDLPADAEALRTALLGGNAAAYGAAANVCAHVALDDYLRREPYLAEIEAQWGPAPGRLQSDARGIQVLGLQLGNVLVAVQPALGYEGDPMRLLFEQGFSPTHAFSAFYRYLREDFAADACLHFGTHGALEFMPGKHAGLSAACWPDRLLRDLPNIYLYAANNPSEGTLAKRRTAATLVSYLTPPVTHAGLYRGLAELRHSIERWRATEPAQRGAELFALILDQAEAVNLTPPAADSAECSVLALSRALDELEQSLIPAGLHVVGAAMDSAARCDVLTAMAEVSGERAPPRAALEALVAGAPRARVLALCPPGVDRDLVERLAAAEAELAKNPEVDALLHALGGGFVRPAPGGDLLRSPEILPTGRNLHAFDPFRMPSAFATAEGARHAELLLARHRAEGHALPSSVAIVLWGTDNMKNEGVPMAQALALLGARPRYDSYARLCGAELVPLAELGRPRIDVVITLSGIFRDLLPLQTRVLAEACLLAASADEPLELNHVRRHALAHQATHGCDLATAALRVFSNADGAYGSNVNHLIEAGTWQDEGELAAAYTARKCFAYGADGRASREPALLNSVLANVDLAYQNLESVELGVTTLDHYFDTLGGIGRAVQKVRGESLPIYIGDQTGSEARVRTLDEQVALETRTRALNPKWYEAMLAHGYEGVRHIETHVTNTMGWSATTGQVAPWVYQRLTDTYILDEAMRERLATLNTQASMRLAHRLLEAHERNYWSPDEGTLAALRDAGDALEDRLEGIVQGVAA